MTEAQEILQEHVTGYLRALESFKRVLSVGTDDPFWPDGVKANIHRSEAIYHRARIISLCRENEWALPTELKDSPIPSRADTFHQAACSPPRPLFEKVKDDLLQNCS